MFNWFNEDKVDKAGVTESELNKNYKKRTRGRLNVYHDSVVSIDSSRISNKKRQNYGEVFWILNCQKETFRIFSSTVEMSEEEINHLVKSGYLIGKSVKFTTFSKYKHVLRLDIEGEKE